MTLLPLALALSTLGPVHFSPTADLALKPTQKGAMSKDWDPMVESKADRDKRMAWFRQARFGMFIHWGLYSVPAGEWNGKDVDGAAEWLQYNAQIKPRDYEPLRDQFNPVNFDANKWVKIAKDAGMKYIVITSKHHEGFGMWPSKQSDWNIGHTQFHRDPLKELSVACKKAGIKLCFYHSIMDWHAPDYLPRKPWDDRPADTADFERYVTYMKAQLKELLTGYGPIGLVWFDGQWESTWNHQRGIDLYRYIRKLQPNIIVNNRVDSGNGRGSDKEAGDYGTPEQTIPANGIPGQDWETCMTMNDTWGFHKTDTNWKSTETLLHNLVDIASKGGNYLLNVGPTSLGEIPDASIERLAEMGIWTKVNSESLYGTSPSPFPHKLAWGRVTSRPGKLYLHVFDGSQGTVELTGLQTPIKKAYLLSNPKMVLPVRAGDNGPVVALPASLPDPIDTVIVAEIAGAPQIDSSKFMSPAASPAADGNFKLTAETANLVGNVQVESDTHAIGFWSSMNDEVSWNLKVPAAGNYTVTLEYALDPSSVGGTFQVTAGNGILSGELTSTGGWRTFSTLTFPPIGLPAGTTTLKFKPLKIVGGGLMNLRSVTLKPQ